MSLKQKTITGVAWNGAANIARQALQILSLIVMARFLSPDDFGVYAILMIFVTFMNIFTSMGVSQVIIHLDNPDQRMLSSIFYLNMAVGIALFGLFYLLAWPIADFFDNQIIVHLLQIIGCSFIITALTVVQKSLLEKYLHFKRVVTLETIALTISSITGIVAAIAGLGIYSLLIATLLNASIFSIGIWLNSHWRPSPMFAFGDIRQIMSYSLNLTGFSIINYFARNADKFLIGKFWGSSALGVYSVAYKIMLYPLDNVSGVIIRVLFPAFSQVKHDNPRFKNSYLKTISLIALVTFPVMAGMLVVARPLVAVIFGEKWQGLSTLLMTLAPIGMVQSIVTTVGSIYTAKGTTALMFKIGAANAVVTVISFVIGLPFGVEGVAIAYAIANAIMLFPNLKISWDQIDLGVLEGLGKLMPFFVASAVMAAMVNFQGAWLAVNNLSPLLVLSLQVLTGIFLYVGVLFLFHRQLILSLLGELRNKTTNANLSLFNNPGGLTEVEDSK